jgi:hypothetical protein
MTEVGEVDVKLARIIQVDELMRHGVLQRAVKYRTREQTGSVAGSRTHRVQSLQAREKSTYYGVLLVEHAVLAEDDAVVGGEASSGGLVARGAVDRGLGRRAALDGEVFEQERDLWVCNVR